jgi:bifunctional pyridoxal-dependent enzyme with beta-cystathionase and maltose regulon repressor activities
LEKIAALAVKYDFHIISDDILADLVLEEKNKYRCLASLDENKNKKLRNKISVILSASKGFNTMGVRCSFLVMHNPEIK